LSTDLSVLHPSLSCFRRSFCRHLTPVFLPSYFIFFSYIFHPKSVKRKKNEKAMRFNFGRKHTVLVSIAELFLPHPGKQLIPSPSEWTKQPEKWVKISPFNILNILLLGPSIEIW
jgi:hypothetical protein